MTFTHESSLRMATDRMSIARYVAPTAPINSSTVCATLLIPYHIIAVPEQTPGAGDGKHSTVQSNPTIRRQRGPKGRGDLRTSLPHRSHAARVAPAYNRLWATIGLNGLSRFR